MNRLLERTLAATRDLRDRALKFEAEHVRELEAVEPRFHESARNLLHYLSVRQQDIRPLQRDLHSLGLSSLGVLEPHVLASLNAVIANLERLAGKEGCRAPASARGSPHRSPAAARSCAAAARTDPPAPLGAHHGHDAVGGCDRRTAARRPAAGRHGRDAHQLRARRSGDLAPHGREPAQGRARGRPQSAGSRRTWPARSCAPAQSPRSGISCASNRAATSWVACASPATVWLTPSESAEAAPARLKALPLPAALLEQANAGDELYLADLRDKERRLTIVGQQGAAWLAEAEKTVYVAQGARCVLVRDGTPVAEATVGDLPGVVLPIPLQVGATLVLTREPVPGSAAVAGPSGSTVRPAHIHCTLPAAFERVQAGDRVWLDDGKIGGIVVANDHAGDPGQRHPRAAGRRPAARGKGHQLSGHRTRARGADGQGSRRPALGRGIRGHGRPVVPAHRAGRRNPRRRAARARRRAHGDRAQDRERRRVSQPAAHPAGEPALATGRA